MSGSVRLAVPPIWERGYDDLSPLYIIHTDLEHHISYKNCQMEIPHGWYTHNSTKHTYKSWATEPDVKDHFLVQNTLCNHWHAFYPENTCQVWAMKTVANFYIRQCSHRQVILSVKTGTWSRNNCPFLPTFQDRFRCISLCVLPAASVPTTCNEVRQRIPYAPDGNYWLQLPTGDMASLYCHEMSTSPRAFINLVAGTDSNFGTDYRAASGTSWTAWAKTYYEKLAIDTQVWNVSHTFLTHMPKWHYHFNIPNIVLLEKTRNCKHVRCFC